MKRVLLFTKEGCKKCDYIKEFITGNTDIQYSISYCDVETPDGLSELAFHELVSIAENALPILLAKGGVVITSVIEMKKFLTDKGGE